VSSHKKTSNQARISLNTAMGVYGYVDGAIGYGIRKIWNSPLRNLWIQKKYNTPLVISSVIIVIVFLSFNSGSLPITPPST
jgi:hypothetical protein